MICTDGTFACDNKGYCVVYCMPQENELSKSSITLSLYKKIMFDNNFKKSFNLVDIKKIWLLSKIAMGR